MDLEERNRIEEEEMRELKKNQPRKDKGKKK